MGGLICGCSRFDQGFVRRGSGKSMLRISYDLADLLGGGAIGFPNRFFPLRGVSGS